MKTTQLQMKTTQADGEKRNIAKLECVLEELRTTTMRQFSPRLHHKNVNTAESSIGLDI